MDAREAQRLLGVGEGASTSEIEDAHRERRETTARRREANAGG